MGFLRRQLLKIIQWEDSSSDTIIYRYPMTDRDEIMNGCQLIVRPSQTAILVSSGQICDVYGEGEHKLTTNNMPIITKLASWKYGFDSPFKAEVYFVNTKQFINQKWGTATKVSLRDNDFGIVRVGARGVYSYKVKDAPLFMREIFGTNRDYSTSSLTEEVEKAIDQRSSLGALGGKMNEFTQYQTAQAIRDAANNPNGGAGMAGMGVGFGAGMAMGNAMMNSVNQQQNQTAQPQQQSIASSGAVCAHCQNPLVLGAKFCSNCGTPVQTRKFCTNCGNQLDGNAKFCPNCGKAL